MSNATPKPKPEPRVHLSSVAAGLRLERPLNSENETVQRQWSNIVRSVASRLLEDNERFKMHSFYAACGGLYY